MLNRLALSVSCLALLAASGAHAQAVQAAPAESDVYTLGEVQVTAHNALGAPLGGAVVLQDTLRDFGKMNVTQALDLIPGVAGSNSGGTRNEGVVYIRGFDRFQTTISLDGIRVYLPADNRLDFSRFLTADLSEIQVAKGYVSVLDGPGGMGGAINLVTRKPTAPFEGELQVGSTHDGDTTPNGYTVSGRIGTKQEKYYLQVSGARSEVDHVRLSDDFTPTPIENGGDRDHSYNNDWRINAKAGWTPNATDEYSINYMRQEGAKGAPYSTVDALATQRYWDWPYWNIASTYFLSNTALGPNAYFKTKAYYNSFDNGLFSYDDPAQTKQTLPKAFRSYYKDKAYGGDLEAGYSFAKVDTLKAAFHYRQDRHDEWQTTYSPTAPAFTEPQQLSVEDTWSVALENTLHASDRIDLVTGVSYDWRRLKRAEDFASNAFVFYRLKDSQALNGQAALTYRFSDAAHVYASVSDRARFPTLFDRFSSRFGGATSNPDLKPERAVNYEIGGSALTHGVKLDAAVFYSDVDNVIVSVPLIFQGQAVTQSRNVGDGKYYGYELSAAWTVGPMLELGGNYTYIQREIKNPAARVFDLTGLPNNKALIYARIRPTEAFSLTPSVELATGRWTTNTAGTLYFKTGDYTLVNLEAAYQFTPKVDLLVGVKNALDQDYQLVYGYPSEGRNFYTNLRLRF